MQVRRSPKTYDVCIIGSGASGGTAAKVLTEGGLSVALLEAGPPLIPAARLQRACLALRFAASRRRRRRPRAPGTRRRIPRSQRRVGDRGRALRLRSGIEVPLVSFAHRRRPHQSLGTHRSAHGAGRFQSPLPRRQGDDWPISYEDVAPYYDKVESYIGVFGTKENIPSAPDGVFLPPPEAALH